MGSETLQHFSYNHLPDHLQQVSMLFYDVAVKVNALPDCREKEKALDRLLEAKDAAVRAARLAEPVAPKKTISTLAVSKENEAAASQALRTG